jgi:hypothetical protein
VPKNAANYEAGVAWHNTVHDLKAPVDYSAAPHAVFCHPQAASFWLKEPEAKQQGLEVTVATIWRVDRKSVAGTRTEMGVGLPGFEPGSIEPESTSLDQASRQPRFSAFVAFPH